MLIQNTPLNKKISYPGLDIAKFLCALLILFYHYFTEHKGLPTIIEEALSLYAVAVALFMVISGFLTFNKIQYIDDIKQRWKVVANQSKRILTIYALWSIPYLIYQIATWEWSAISFGFIIREIQRWIFSSTFYTIWFLPTLAIGLIVAFFITEKLPLWCQIIVGIILYSISCLMLAYSFLGDKIPCFQSFTSFCETWLGGSRGWLVFATPLLMLGKLMASIKDKLKWKFCLLLSVFFMGTLLAEALILRKFVGHTGIDLTITMGLAVFFILGFLLHLKFPDRACFVWMRKMSLLIFVSQRLFLTVITDLLPSNIQTTIFQNTYLGCVLLCGSTIAFCCLIITLSNKLTWLKKLY